MRFSFSSTALAAVAVALCLMPSPSKAADTAEEAGIPDIEIPETLPLINSSGWYLRGDIGYQFPEHLEGHSHLPGLGGMANETLGESGLIGLGVGYRLNSYFRVDGTLDYQFDRRLSGAFPTVSARAQADLDAVAGLVNSYIDLGTYAGVTPFIGGGAGFSYLSTRDVASNRPGLHAGDSDWNFAWALMAGLAYDLTDQLTVDMSYRYLNLGDAKAYAGGPLELNNIAAHEIRIGLRYNLY